eukprot:m.44219 g.44219  ORF g.44219 m.44219 type:complete len:50 (+) comp10070_c0_seq2:54-203(+)
MNEQSVALDFYHHSQDHKGLMSTKTIMIAVPNGTAVEQTKIDSSNANER